MIGWGVLAGRVDAVARRLASSRARDVLGPGGSSRRGDRSWLGRAPRTSCGPISDRAAAAAHTVSAAPRHVTQRFLHDAHEPLLPGAPICSSSSRPLLVVSSRTTSSRSRTSSSSSSFYSFCLSLGSRLYEVTKPFVLLLASTHVSSRSYVLPSLLAFTPLLPLRPSDVSRVLISSGRRVPQLCLTQGTG